MKSSRIVEVLPEIALGDPEIATIVSWGRIFFISYNCLTASATVERARDCSSTINDSTQEESLYAEQRGYGLSLHRWGFEVGELPSIVLRYHVLYLR